ncbi:MAG: MMPL family transporter [Candidatus Riflebacteria bacterium]|nr:MMPL family transporter [Candidatus Riflebacteria bacterium]
MIRAWFGMLLAWRRVALTACFVAILILSAGMARLDVDFNVESFFPRDDGKTLAFNRYIKTFGRDDDLLLVLVKAVAPLSPDFVTALDVLVRQINGLGLAGSDCCEITNGHPLFSDVWSFLDTPYPWLRDDNILRIGPLRERVMANGGRPDATFLDAFVASMSLKGPVLGNFLDPANHTAVLMVKLAPGFADNRGRMEATRTLRAFLGKESGRFPGVESFTVSGMPAARADGMELIQRDQARLLPIAFAVNVIMLVLLFRRGIDVMLVVIQVMLTLAVTLGIMGHLGLKFSIISSVMPVILLTTGSSYGIQILTRLRTLRSTVPDISLVDVFTQMAGPVFLANFTTVVGFFSLYNADMKLINEFAAVTAGGVFIAYIMSVTVFPLLISIAELSPIFSPTPGGRFRDRRTLRMIVLSISRLVTHRPRAIVVLFLAIGMIMLWFAAQTKTRTYVFDDFRPDSLLMKHIRQAEQVCRGVLPMSVVVTSRSGRVVLREKFIAKSAEIAAFLRTLPEVGKVDSPSDLIRDVWLLLTEDPGTAPANGELPPDDASLANIMRLLLANGGKADIGQRLVSDDLSALRVKFRIRDIESNAAAALIDKIRAFIIGLEDEETTVNLTGTTVMIQEAYRNILGNLVVGFLAVIGITILVFAIAFPHIPSVILGFLGNIIPMFGIMALMALNGITFKPSTTTIFGIALGMAVDNTIYFFREYWTFSGRGFSRAGSVRRALLRAGEGILVSSLTLAAGFSVLMSSEFEAQFLIGLLLSFSVGLALMYDLLFVPAGMVLFGPRQS